MVESEDLAQLRQLNLKLMQQLWVGQEAVRQSVAKAASESSPDSKSSYDSEIPSSQEVSSVALRASCLPDAHQGDPCDVSWLRRASSRVISLSRGTCQYQKSLGPLGPQKAPTSNSNDPELSAELDSPGSQEDPEILRSQALRSTLDQRSMLSKRRVTFSREPPVPEESWRLRPYLGYDWIAAARRGILRKYTADLIVSLLVPKPSASVQPHLLDRHPHFPPATLTSWLFLKHTKHTSAPGPLYLLVCLPGSPHGPLSPRSASLDSSSPVTSKPEAFFSKLQKFREANKEECINSDPESQFLGLPGSSGVEGEHECVYSYRVNRRLFLVPSDPGTPCRLCRTPRDQRGPETLAEPAQVRVSVPLSLLDPPHRYHIHRRKSFDASDTLALPRHCLLGWDVLPPKSDRSSAPKSLDLWSCVSSKAQHQQLSASGPSHVVWSRVPQEGQTSWGSPGEGTAPVPGGRMGAGREEPDKASLQGPVPWP
ncbi:migration and invasion-inhibitory protein isoform X2 [Manis javanica]|uniref:migration and invasion-inhibitory protein isoform X2 n=1 Tax=Manis javanica TaxID=9974 RepID=UPI003C6CEEF6